MILIDGKSENTIPADDRGLAYGDGLFETIKIQNGRPILWQSHIDRLVKGCRVLGLQEPDGRKLFEECTQLTAGSEKGIIKIMLTRGSGGRGYRPDDTCVTRRIVSFHRWPEIPEEYYTHGINLYKCTTPVTDNRLLAGLKTLCRLEQVMAQREWAEPDYAEGLMLDNNGLVIEGTRSNIFVFIDSKLYTPVLAKSGIRGIMRDIIMDIADGLGMPAQESDISHTMFIEADEVFVCNSIFMVFPVAKYLDKQFDSFVQTRMIMNSLESNISRYE